MGRVHYALLVVLVLYFPLRVKPGPVKDGDVSSDVTTEKADPFKAADMINLYRCSALLRTLESEKLFSLVFLFHVFNKLQNILLLLFSSGSDFSEKSDLKPGVSNNQTKTVREWTGKIYLNYFISIPET